MPATRNYRVCCCHARTWTLVIGILELIYLLAYLVLAIIAFAKREDLKTPGFYGFDKAATEASVKLDSKYELIIWAILFGFYLVVVLLLVIGVVKDIAGFLIPHIIMQFITVILLLVYCGFIFYVTIKLAIDKKEPEYKGGEGVWKTALYGAGQLIGALVQIFFLYVVVRCYQYIRELRGR